MSKISPVSNLSIPHHSDMRHAHKALSKTGGADFSAHISKSSAKNGTKIADMKNASDAHTKQVQKVRNELATKVATQFESMLWSIAWRSSEVGQDKSTAEKIFAEDLFAALAANQGNSPLVENIEQEIENNMKR